MYVCMCFYMRISVSSRTSYIQVRIYFSSQRTATKNQFAYDICPWWSRSRVRSCEIVSNYVIDDVLMTSTYYLTDSLVLKDNDQCGRYCVNDLTDVSKMRLRVAGCSRDRFVITTSCVSSGDYDLPNDVQTNNENGAQIYRTLWAVERNYINTACTIQIITVWAPWYAIYRNFSLCEMKSWLIFYFRK